MLRLVVNRAKQHYNNALEHVERGRLDEAKADLASALKLNHNHVGSHNVLGTIYAREGRYKEAVEEWEKALDLDKSFSKAHDYIQKAVKLDHDLKWRWRVAIISAIAAVLGIICLFAMIREISYSSTKEMLVQAQQAYKSARLGEVFEIVDTLENKPLDPAYRTLFDELKYNSERRIKEIFRAAESLDRNAEFDLALKQLDKIGKLNPPNKDLEKARILANKIITKKIEFCLNTAAVHIEAYEFDEAEKVLKPLLTEYPNHQAKSRIEDQLAEIKNLRDLQSLDDINKLVKEGKWAETLKKVDEIANPSPELQEKLEQFRIQAFDKLFIDTLNSLKKMIAEKQYSEAITRINIYISEGLEGIKLGDEMKQVLITVRAETKLEWARALLDNNEYSTAAELLKDAESGVTDSELIEKIINLREIVERKAIEAVLNSRKETLSGDIREFLSSEFDPKYLFSLQQDTEIIIANFGDTSYYDNAVAFNAAAKVLQSNWPGALKVLELMNNENSSFYDDALFMKALSLEKQKKCLESLSFSNKLITDFPNSPYVEDAIFYQALCYREMGDNASCSMNLSKMLAEYPNTHWRKEAEEILEEVKEKE
jgi:tetratricopeptide (TPR) repeat protein